MEHDVARAVNFLQFLRDTSSLTAAAVAKHHSALSSLWGPLPEYNFLWLGKIPVVAKYLNAIRSIDAAELLTADNGNVDRPIPMVLEDDIINKMILGPDNANLLLRELSGKFCTHLILGSKRRPSCLTRTTRADVRWTDTDFCSTVVLPKEARHSVAKSRPFVCERLSLDPKADVVSVYNAYVERSFQSPTLLVQCRKQKGRVWPPVPNTICHWVRDYLVTLGYPLEMMITPYMLIKSVTTAQLSAGRDVEIVSQHRWDSSSTMLKHYDLRGKLVSVLRPQL